MTSTRIFSTDHVNKIPSLKKILYSCARGIALHFIIFREWTLCSHLSWSLPNTRSCSVRYLTNLSTDLLNLLLIVWRSNGGIKKEVSRSAELPMLPRRMKCRLSSQRWEFWWHKQQFAECLTGRCSWSNPPFKNSNLEYSTWVNHEIYRFLVLTWYHLCERIMLSSRWVGCSTMRPNPDDNSPCILRASNIPSSRWLFPCSFSGGVWTEYQTGPDIWGSFAKSARLEALMARWGDLNY